MTFLKSIALSTVTFIILTIISVIFDDTFTEVAVIFLIAQGASIVIHFGVIEDKLNEKGRE